MKYAKKRNIVNRNSKCNLYKLALYIERLEYLNSVSSFIRRVKRSLLDEVNEKYET